HRAGANEFADLVRSDAVLKGREVNGPGGRWKPIERATVAGVRSQERLDLAAEHLVATGRGREKRGALRGGPFNGGLKELFDPPPSIVRHVRSAVPSSRFSQAFAVRQSRLAVDGDTLSTCAASSIVSPPNARSSTTLASSGSTASSRLSA